MRGRDASGISSSIEWKMSGKTIGNACSVPDSVM